MAMSVLCRLEGVQIPMMWCETKGGGGRAKLCPIIVPATKYEAYQKEDLRALRTYNLSGVQNISETGVRKLMVAYTESLLAEQLQGRPNRTFEILDLKKSTLDRDTWERKEWGGDRCLRPGFFREGRGSNRGRSDPNSLEARNTSGEHDGQLGNEGDRG
eukprot:9502136-Pyramimonas_sp.AAC.1